MTRPRLVELPIWVIWKREERDARVTKVPYNPTTGARAKSDDPVTWASYAAATANTNGAAGIGFQLGLEDDPTGIVFVDFDHCRNSETGEIEDWALEKIRALNSLTEISQSGEGLHVLCWGTKPAHDHCEMTRPPGSTHPEAEVGIYTHKRFVALTTKWLPEFPREPQEREAEVHALYRELWPPKPEKSKPEKSETATTPPGDKPSLSDKQVMARCRQARSRDKFVALFDRGDLGAHNGNHSDCDASLCYLLARWTNDEEQIYRLVQQSKLYRAEKWERDDYRENTIRKAIAFVAETRAKAANQFFDADLGFVSKRMGEYLNDEARILVGADGRLYRYRHGVYRPDGLSWAASRTRELLGEAFKRKHWVEVREWLLADEPRIGLDAQADRLNLPNGRLNWRTGEMEPHSEEVLDMIRIPVPWKPDAACPRFDQFLVETLPPDAIDFVLELLGYLLVPLTRYQKAVMLLGPTGTGKSTLLHVIRQLCGPENVSTQPLHAFAEDRFATSSLFGKLANVCGDLDAHQVRRSDVFKQLSGEDAIQSQFKYGHSFTFLPFSRLIFSANEAPASADSSDAYFTRWLIVPMTTRFRDTEREDTRLRERLSTELPGILRHAVDGLRALEARGRFEVPQSMSDAARDFRLRADTVSAFVAERVTFGQGWCTRLQLREAYEEWCRQNGLMAATAHAFYDRFRDDYPVTEAAREGIRGFKGLWLRWS